MLSEQNAKEHAGDVPRVIDKLRLLSLLVVAPTYAAPPKMPSIPSLMPCTAAHVVGDG
jgi:hypothetical protein